MKCCVLSCKNYSDRRSDAMTGITFHLFPSEENHKQQWITKINRQDWIPTKYTKICSCHFNDDDFIVTKKGLRKLRKDTLPSLKLDISLKRKLLDPTVSSRYPTIPTSDLNEFLILHDTPKRKKLKQEIAKLRGIAKVDGLKNRRLQLKDKRLKEKDSIQPIRLVCSNQKRNSDGSMPAVNKRKIKVFCPKCKTKILHDVEGMQEDETTKSIIANVYHYFEQEYKELTKTYVGVDLTPLSKFSERTALATGVSVSTVLEILQERARRNADVPQKPPLKRPRQPESSSEEDSCGGDEDDGEHSTTEHVVDTLVVKEEPETYNDESEVYVELADVKTEPDACGDDRELADPISVNIRTEPQNERDTTSTEAVAVQSAAKRHTGSIKQRHAEASPASCAAPSGHSDCETLAALSAAKRHKGSIKQRHAEAPPASCAAPSGHSEGSIKQRHAEAPPASCAAPSAQLPLPPDQHLKLHNPLTNQQGFSKF